MTTSNEELADMIKEKEKELYDMKKEYRERRTEGLRSAMEQRKEAENLVRDELKALGYEGRDTKSVRWYSF